MATIFYSREDVNQSKFIFDVIRERNSKKLHRTIILAPKQFTFQIERDAFRYMGNSAVMAIDVMGFQRLGNQIVKSAGGDVEKIGVAGRKMIVSKIVRSVRDDFRAFREVADNEDFLQMLCDGMADLKRQNTSSEDLNEVLNKLEATPALREKVRDLSIVFGEYSKYLEGKYLDGEDFMELYNRRIKDAKFIRETDIWIYGFDLFDEKMFDTVAELEEYAASLNIVLTYDKSKGEEELFKLGQETITKFKNLLKNCQEVKIEEFIESRAKSIGNEKEADRFKESYKINSQREIHAIEKNLYKLPLESSPGNGGIDIFQCANQYYEAVNAAAYVKKIIREKGYRYRDIVIINNEIETLGEMYKRVFRDYGIDLFLDETKSLRQNTVMTYLKGVIGGIEDGFSNENLMEILNSEFFEEMEDEINDLEIYSRNYLFKSSDWEEKFTKGKNSYEEDEIEKFNLLRTMLVVPLINLKKALEEERVVEKKISVLWNFLEKEFKIRSRIKKLNIKDVDGNFDDLETAQENAQVWNKVVDVLNQMLDILGDEDMENEEFCHILTQGLDTVEVGVIPPTSDCLILSDMMRMKKGITNVTLIVNGVDGILPLDGRENGIFTSDETEILKDAGIHVTVPIQSVSAEEKINIYRNISKTTDELYLSYAISNQSGEKLEQSMIMEAIREILPDVEVQKDWISQGKITEIIGGKEITKELLIEEIIKIIKGSTKMDETEQSQFLKALFKWHFNEDAQVTEILDRGILEERILRIPKELAGKLYLNDESGVLNLSPSRLELFGKCPFAHFMSYGIRPEIEKVHKVESSDLGSIYHYCMKHFVDRIFDDADELSIENIRRKDDVYPHIDEILEALYEEYNEGILRDGREEEYRKERIREVCADSIFEVAKQLQEESLKDILCEVNFGRGKKIPEIKIEKKADTDGNPDGSFDGDTSPCREICISGQIDRLDIDELGYGKVVDYKSGNEKFLLEEAEAGIKLQLFIYLMATAGYKMKGLGKVKPKGAFYFGIKENLTDLDGNKNSYKLDGFIKKDEEEKINRDVYITGDRHVFEAERFETVMDMIGDKIRSMALAIEEGEIKIEPKKVGLKESCEFCSYRGICRFDLSIEGCNYKGFK